MKSTIILMRCLWSVIKKIFFNTKKRAQNLACEELLKVEQDRGTFQDQAKAEEYADNYRLATRWQTI